MPRPLTKPVDECHWAVKFLHRQMVKQGMGPTKIGSHPNTYRHWALGVSPSIDALEAALNKLGYRLAVRSLKEDKLWPE